MLTIPHRVPSTATFRTPVPDPHNQRAGDWLRAWDGTADLTAPDAVLIGAPLSRTSLSHSGAHLLPQALRQTLLDFSTYDIEHDVALDDLRVYDLGDIALDLLDPRISHAQIQAALQATYSVAPLVLLVGGDHSITRPALLARAAVAGATLGVIQFDAHHDVRVLDHGPNNGTPIRGAIEGGAILGAHVAQIGIRGFVNAAEYTAWARAQGIGISTLAMTRQRGILPTLEAAWSQAALAPGGVYITVDMDVLDRAQAPGCPASVPGGMDLADLLEALFRLGQRAGIVGIDFVEVDPTRDIANQTVKATCLALLSFLGGRASLNRTRGTQP